MFQSIDQLKNLVLSAADGEIGRSKDFLIDDRAWVVRYMVADTGKWLPARKVLIVPQVLEVPDRQANRLPLRLTRQQIEQSPELDTDAPVSRQYEAEYHSFFGLPYYWSEPAITEAVTPTSTAVDTSSAEGHLRSTTEISGYHLRATDGEIGKVSDFLIDDESWMIRYLIIDIDNWIKGRKILLSPAWLGEVDWAPGRITVHMTKDQLEKSPEYNAEAPIGRDYEEQLHEHYKLPNYWDEPN